MGGGNVLVSAAPPPSQGHKMLIRIAAAIALMTGVAAEAQQAAQPAKPNLQQLLSAGYDLKAVTPAEGPCGNQPANRTQSCRREYYYLQSPRKDAIFRCELGLWNGRIVQDCNRV
jgi:hypothetical protein